MYNDLEVAHPQSGSLSVRFLVEDGGKPEYLEKISRRKGENQQQTQHPHMALTPGFEPGPNCWEASALTTECAILVPQPRKRTRK